MRHHGPPASYTSPRPPGPESGASAVYSTSPVDISSLGHACFRLRGRDLTIVTDPHADPAWDYPPVTGAADVVTVSHEHPHHDGGAAALGTRARVLRRPGEYETHGAMIWGVRTFRRADGADEAQPRPKNVSFVIQVDGLTVCHLGDLGHALTAEQLEHVQSCDVLLVPVGGHCTLDAGEAAAVAAQVEPRIIIPMHYGSPQTEGRLALDSVDRFCKEMGATDTAPQPKLTVTASSLPAATQVVLLEPPRR